MMRYYLFRFGREMFRCEKARSVEEACQLAFGTVYMYPSAGSVVYKDIGTRSPKYASQKQKQSWYSEGGWKVIGKED